MNTSEVREIILRVNGEDAQQKIRGNAKIQSLIGNLSRLKVLPTAISLFLVITSLHILRQFVSSIMRSNETNKIYHGNKT